VLLRTGRLKPHPNEFLLNKSPCSPSIKRIVITSSTAAVLHPNVGPKIYTEADWNEGSIKTVEALGVEAPQMEKYRASKALAEKAAWDFVEKNKDAIGWDLVTLNPPYVFGPTIHEVSSSATSLNYTAFEWYNTIVHETMDGKSLEALKTTGSCWIDVRDVGLAHALALEKEEAGGERILITAGAWVWQDWLDCANSLQPTPIPSHPSLPKGTPGGGKGATYLNRYDTSKASRILGIKFLTMEESTRDTLKDFEERGW